MVKDELSKKDIELSSLILNILKEQFDEYLKSINCANFEMYEEYISKFNTENEKEYIDFFENACNFYKFVAVFPTDENKAVLKKLFNLKDEYLIWITDFKEITKEIESINLSSEIYVSHGIVYFTYYILYLPTKIRNILYEAFDFKRIHNRKLKNIAEIVLYNTYQNFKNRNKKGDLYKKNEFEELIIEIENVIKFSDVYSFTKKEAKAILWKEATGNVEKIYLPFIFHNSFSSKNLAESLKLRYFFNLYKLILKEEKWMSEEEFENGEIFDKKKNPTSLYNNSYERYKEMTMRNFLRNT